MQDSDVVLYAADSWSADSAIGCIVYFSLALKFALKSSEIHQLSLESRRLWDNRLHFHNFQLAFVSTLWALVYDLYCAD